jgi:hypothetical protein
MNRGYVFSNFFIRHHSRFVFRLLIIDRNLNVLLRQLAAHFQDLSQMRWIELDTDRHIDVMDGFRHIFFSHDFQYLRLSESKLRAEEVSKGGFWNKVSNRASGMLSFNRHTGQKLDQRSVSASWSSFQKYRWVALRERRRSFPRSSGQCNSQRRKSLQMHGALPGAG